MNFQGGNTREFDVVPSETEVVIVGGGIIGVCTALQLAQRGVPVVLCEKGTIGEEQSSRNWGWVRKMGRDIREMYEKTRAQGFGTFLPANGTPARSEVDATPAEAAA